MALNAKNNLSIADHEGFHYAEDRILMIAERQIIANAFKPGRPLFEKLMASVRRYDLENQTRLADEVASIPAEARAYGFEFWRRGELQVEGALQRVFAKIRLFFEKVANLVKGLGFQSLEDVFVALDRGQFSERQKNQASGLLGVPLASYAGISTLPNTKSLQRTHSIAVEMEKRGENTDAIRLTTGWFRNPYDKEWRREFSDRGAKLIAEMPAAKGAEPRTNALVESPLFGNETAYKLGDVLAHPLLYKIYPEAKDIDFVVRRGFFDFGGLQGWFDGANKIGITPYAKEPLSTIFHEVQHWIQKQEGFATGGNAESVIKSLTAKQKQRAAEKLTVSARIAVSKARETRAVAQRIMASGIGDQWLVAGAEADILHSAWKQSSAPDAYNTPEYQAWNKAYHQERVLGDALTAVILGRPYDGNYFNLSDEDQRLVFRIKNKLEDAKASGALLLLANKDIVAAQKEISSIQSGDPKVLEAALRKSGETYNLYQLIAGEIEARDVQAREGVGIRDRRTTPPLSSFEADPTDVIITRDAAGSFSFHSKAAVDMTRQVQAGELQPQQFYNEWMKLHDDAAEHGPESTYKAAYGAVSTEVKGSLARWWQKNMATTNFISHFSGGVKNVYHTLNTYIRFRKLLIENNLRGKMPTWYHASFNDQDITFAALLKRTVNGYTRGSAELADLRRGLETPERQRMFDDATRMIEGFLSMELESDQQEWKNFYIPGYESLPAAKKAEMDGLIEQHRQVSNEQAKLLSKADWVEWDKTKVYRDEITNREAQVADLIDKGYVPLRRYGDHVVVVYRAGVGPEGAPLVVNRMGFESEAQANFAVQEYADELARQGLTEQYKVELGFQHKSARETTVSARQFIDTARRNGVPLTQPEIERIIKALTRADSMLRNRMMRRQGTPGFSVDGMRVLNEFGVGMSGKIAYAKFATAIDAAAAGRAVTSDVVNGEAVITTDESMEARDRGPANLWTLDGPKSGFYRNVSDEITDYVLVPDHTGGWSKKLRGAAMVYFLGLSISGAMVNTMSVPLLTVPELAIHTNYYNAMATTLSSWKQSWQHQGTLRDLEKLKDKDAFPMKEIDSVPGLRDAIIAAADVIFDTEVNQIMGIAEGTVYSKSRNVQRAVEAWMQPFRISEQMNRATSFIAAYKVGQQKGMNGQQLFTFAREIVDSTQNNYNPSNRPGMARDPIYAIMFMFKSFPLFMVEAAVLMFKASPKNAVYMLLGLTAMTGVQGLPFAETLEDIIDTIAQRVFNSPFNTRRAMRNIIKQASEAIVGYDMSELVLRGVINEVFGISASSRIGTGDFVPGSRLGAADADQGRVLEQVLGAPFAMLKDTLENAGKLVGGVVTGDWKQSVDALRAGGPIALRNVIKGGEQLADGYASDSKGRRIVDVGTPSALFQTIGLAPASLAAAYDRDRTDKQVMAFYTQVRTDMEHELVRAIREGDQSRAQDVWDAAIAWDASNPDYPLRLNPAAMRRQIVMSGMRLDERTLRLLPRQLRGTSLAAEGIGQ